ncbi:nuclear transport factor 2 family protein [Caulobacter mirabilis]|uniref:Ketosteroid isomerase n=1 Tax=Caulobacter mirabilis TaxID=69666 RepID=A0A2D2AX62_9CAUL|nr:nuclear transport factor 2 family protein [Caulobacter mirabilis]ATQ42527.1 ketosteroid isomerase [Caulobacter mirabilis]
MGEDEALVTRLYEALNRQDVDALVALVHPDVDWQDLLDGGRRHGPEAMRDYWTQQFAVIRPEVSPIAFERLPDGRLAVQVFMTIASIEGRPWEQGPARFAFTLDGGLIRRMDAISY